MAIPEAPEPSAPAAATPVRAASLPARLVALLRWEDVLLSVVAFAGLPLLGRLMAGSGGPLPATGAGAPTPLLGAVGLVAILGVFACLCTRGPGERAALAGDTMTLQGWARFPLAAGLAIIALETVPGLGIDPDPLVALAFLLAAISAFAGGRMPVAPVAARRLMVTPMALVATGVFDDILGAGSGGVGATLGGVLRGDAPPEVTAVLPLILGAIAVLYTMLVIAPRAIADPGASGLAWIVRFLLLLASLFLGNAVFGV